jgi:Arc/MetJ-type ribon-helix-helix transcriptional regulator
MSSNDEYTTVRLPNELMEEIDEIIRLKIRGYKSKSEFIKEAIRKSIEELKKGQLMPELQPLEHFNLNEQGVIVLDRTLASKTSSGKVIDVYFKPGSVWCDYCQSSSCQHTKFSLKLPEVQEILKRKKQNST